MDINDATWHQLAIINSIFERSFKKINFFTQRKSLKPTSTLRVAWVGINWMKHAKLSFFTICPTFTKTDIFYTNLQSRIQMDLQWEEEKASSAWMEGGGEGENSRLWDNLCESRIRKLAQPCMAPTHPPTHSLPSRNQSFLTDILLPTMLNHRDLQNHKKERKESELNIKLKKHDPWTSMTCVDPWCCISYHTN